MIGIDISIFFRYKISFGMVKRDTVLHFELYIDGTIQQSIRLTDCDVGTLLNGVAHLFKEALSMPKPSDSLTSSQLALQQLGESEAVGNCGTCTQQGCPEKFRYVQRPRDSQSPSDIEYLHVQYFNQDIATSLPAIVAYPNSLLVNLADWRCRP